MSELERDSQSLSEPMRLEYLRVQKNLRYAVGLYTVTKNRLTEDLAAKAKAERHLTRYSYIIAAALLLYALSSIFFPALKLSPSSTIPVIAALALMLIYVTETIIFVGLKKQSRNTDMEVQKAESLWVAETGDLVSLQRIYSELTTAARSSLDDINATADIFWLHDSRCFKDVEAHVLDQIKGY